MKIGSLSKTSLLDYPGKISTIIGTQGCNMCCPWCHNSFLIPYAFTPYSEILQEADFYRFLEQRRGFLEGVVITGGEPTLQPDLPEVCEQVKKMGLAVKIDTNGTHPEMLKTLMANALVDYIAMDIKTDLHQYPQLFKADINTDGILESIETIISSTLPYEFRTTCISPFVSIENIDQVGRLIKGARCLYLQKCNPTQTIQGSPDYEIADVSRLTELKQRAAAHVITCDIRHG